MHQWKRKLIVTSIGVMLCMPLIGCGTSPTSTTNSTTKGRASTTAGIANVAYAGSLQLTNDQYIQPAFTKATGFGYRGFGEGANAVANLIKSKQITPNVFESIGIPPLKTAGRGRVQWAVGFASSPLVIAYSKQSPFAGELKQIADGQKPISALFSLMEKPNFHLGRTDPNTDPQGQSFVMMMHLAEQELHLPRGTANKILGSLENSSEVYPETDILSRLQSGELDASSAYLPEAIQKGLPFIKLPNTVNMGSPADAKLYATQSVTLSNGLKVTGAPVEVYVSEVTGTPDPSAGTSFIRFTLSKQGLDIYRKMGYTMTPYELWGLKSAIPQAIQKELKG